MKHYGTDPNLPNYARPDYIAREPDLQLIADETGGTRTMHARSTTYIRKWSGEKVANYNIRRVCESFFEGFGRTLSAAVGMLFAKSPTIGWNQSEELMSPHWDNIDGAGNNGPVFVKRFSEAALRDGLSVIVVDHPSPPDGQEVTGQLEERLNLRPMWRRYDRRDAINWLVEIVDNVATLTQVSLLESAMVRQGTFGTKAVLRYRDLRLEPQADGSRVATWVLRELVEGNATSSSFNEIGRGTFRNKDGETRSTLPIAIAYTGRSDMPMDSAIPLLGVAWANLNHWQLSTSLRFNSEVAGLAQPTVIGEMAADPITGAPQKLEIGPLVAVHMAAGGEFKWVEPSGSGLERLAVLVLEKLHQIAKLGMTFLQSDTRAAETAEAKRLDAAAENATLATAATGIQDAVNLALEQHAWYLGIEKADAPTLTISHDFEATTMAADIMTAYVQAVRDAGLPIRILLEAWQAAGRIGPDEDLALLENEMAAAARAIADQKAADAAAALAKAQAGVPSNGNGAPPPPPKNARPTVPPVNRTPARAGA